MSHRIRAATSADAAAIVALLPRLADFDVPSHRVPEALWHGDRALIESWADGGRADVHARVAVDADGVLGAAALSTREELLDHTPSTHLEILVLHRRAEGTGVGSALLREMERTARALGAGGMSLHVFARNARARALYERHGFDGEIVRYFKPLV